MAHTIEDVRTGGELAASRLAELFKAPASALEVAVAKTRQFTLRVRQGAKRVSLHSSPIVENMSAS